VRRTLSSSLETLIPLLRRDGLTLPSAEAPTAQERWRLNCPGTRHLPAVVGDEVFATTKRGTWLDTNRMWCTLLVLCAQRHWYLRMGAGSESAISRLLFDPDSRAIVGILDFLTLFILYSSLIPISLYVSIEIIKFFQARLWPGFLQYARDEMKYLDFTSCFKSFLGPLSTAARVLACGTSNIPQSRHHPALLAPSVRSQSRRLCKLISQIAAMLDRG